MINVIFIDDELKNEAMHANIWQEKLDPEKIEFKVKVYSSPSEALENQETFSYNTIIVLDLQMPELDGDAFLHKIRQHDIHIPVIIYSGNVKINDNKKIVSLIKDNIFTYIEKHNRDEVIDSIIEASKMLKDIVPLELSEALSEYIERKPERKSMQIITKAGVTYTLEEIVKEINEKSTFGVDYQKALYKMSFEDLAEGDKSI